MGFKETSIKRIVYAEEKLWRDWYEREIVGSFEIDGH